MVANILWKQKIRWLGVEGVIVMARGKGGGGDDWGKFFGIVIGVGVGALAVYYLTAGRGEESNAALIPDDLEGQIDFVVEGLNREFGTSWVDRGLDALQIYLKNILPWQIVGLIGVIYQVEQLSRTRYMSGQAKKEMAVKGVRGY
jgi:hypothetical protein